MNRSTRWAERTTRQKLVIVGLAAVEVAMLAAALGDLARRPNSRVRGPKVLWGVGCFVQPVGPIAYFAFGRRPEPRASQPAG